MSDEGFRERLARLRREGAGGRGGAENSPPGSGGFGERPVNEGGRGAREAAGGADERGGEGARAAPGRSGVRELLARRAAFSGRGREPDRSPAAAEDAASAGRTLGDPAGLRERAGPAGPYVERVSEFPPARPHGAQPPAAALGADPRVFAWLVGDPALERLDPARAVYLDVETTGLSGGAGTIVFLVGLGGFAGECFRLRQVFLRSPAEERAALAAVAETIRAASGVISFFGKSFDRHRLEDKMRLHGIAPPFEGLPHLDLYHPLRRLYRAALPDARLQTMERALCAVERADDLPGSFAPEAWFDYLAGRPHRLEGVFCHNADDVLSLATLAAHLARVPEERGSQDLPLPGCARARATALGRIALKRGERERAARWLSLHHARCRADGLAPTSPEYRESAWRAGEAWRLVGRWELAEPLLREAAEGAEDRWALPARVALAKYAEHARRDRALALEHARAALKLAERVLAGDERRRHVSELQRRVERLERRNDGAPAPRSHQ